ncbi:hypothetical protein GCM10019071_19500 [Sphingobium fuliginis]|uniref:Uncharacterized protein n=1 Tax=Sphingobium fuliginis (strain ATCC 27551) TaxID=336203 RepID=A0ABQ1EWF3_SPHSA|nr:hypothetical protein GCM10019071_19500 [Sphingobium fuliginis]
MRYSLIIFALTLGILGVVAVDAMFSAATSIMQSAVTLPQ